MPTLEYWYNAEVVRVYDADTVWLNIDLGFETWLQNVACRLYGINAPEMRGPEKTEGLISRDWLIARLTEVDGKVRIQSHKGTRGKYGRWLVVLWADGVNLNEALVDVGLAEAREY